MAKTGPVPQPGILEISAYVPGESNVPGGVRPDQAFLQRDATGAEPQGGRRLQGRGRASRTATRTARRRRCRNAIAKLYGLDPDRIVVGSGSDELINLIAHAYIGPGDEAVYSEHGFLMYKIATLSSGGKPVSVPEKSYSADVDAILARVTPKTKVVFLANPNNPTGTYLPHEEVRRLHKGLPSRTLLVIDAAYCEYVRRNDYEAGLGAGRHHRQHGDDAHLLQDLRPGGAAARLGLLPRRCGRRAQPHARTVQRQRTGALRRAWPRSTTAPTSSMP